MIRVIFLHFFLIWSIVLHAQLNNIAISQKLTLHAAVSDNIIDATSIISNQAAGLTIEGLNYGVIAEKKYLMSELNQLIFFGSKNYGKNAVTIIQDYNGFTESYSMQTTLGFTKYISDNTSLGLRFNYMLSHIKGNLNSNSIGGEISLKHKLTKDLQTGLIIINPQYIFSKKNNHLADNKYCYKWGLLYDVSKQFYLFIDFIKTDLEQLGIIGGCTYNFNKIVDATYSISVHEMSNRFSIGFKLKKMKIKLMNSFHPQLGYSPSITLLSNLNNKIVSN
jgi:hypothetical protein